MSFLTAILLCTAPLQAADVDQTATPAEAAVSAAPAARAAGHTIEFDEFDTLLLDRYALAPEGRDALQFVVRTKLLGQLAEREGLEITDDMLRARWLELDAQLIESGIEGGLEAQVRESGVDRETFIDTLRLALVQEELTRRALGIAAGEPVGGDAQMLWLDEQTEQAGFEALPMPWEDGVVGKLGDAPIFGEELAAMLREQLPASELREALAQMLLERAVTARLGALQPAQIAVALDAEIERRRAEFAANPMYKDVSFESLLAARGRNLELLRNDPSVRVAALGRLWVATEYGDDGVRQVYEDERAEFDARYGEALHVRALWLQAGVGTERTLDAAMVELDRLARQAVSESSFATLARDHSDDTASSANGGELGFLTRRAPGVAPEIVQLAFKDSDAGAEGLSGPHAIDSGALLLWIGERRPAPHWNDMSREVERELLRRFLVETLPTESVTTYLDADESTAPAEQR